MYILKNLHGSLLHKAWVELTRIETSHPSAAENNNNNNNKIHFSLITNIDSFYYFAFNGTYLNFFFVRRSLKQGVSSRRYTRKSTKVAR